MNKEVLKSMQSVINSEIDALNDLHNQIENDQSDYLRAIEVLRNCRGHVIFMGVGKTGHIGKKLAATFASLGTPSFFVHATELMHGDLGMITKDDVVIAISNSGETKESITPLPFIKRIGAKTIAITGNKSSSLAKKCDYNILVHVDHEADQLNLAPTSSSTAALVVGDAIACVLSQEKNFKEIDFAGFHPGGALGQKLLKNE